MTEDEYRTLSFCVDSIVALGTVGALLAALRAFGFERSERRRSEIRGVRSWVRWVDPTTEEDRDALPEGQPWPEDGYVPELCIENGSDEFIYDVDLTLWPTQSGVAHFSAHRMSIAPGQRAVSRLGIAVEAVATYLRFDAGGVGVEAIFRDARGDRWVRTRRGQLRRLRPLRWYAPWRIPHETEDYELPTWAMPARWRYRWREAGERDLQGWPPQWWAIDIRWERWAFARQHDPVSIPWWRIDERWAARHDIAQRRARNRLPIPWWAIDDRIRHSLSWRAWARDARRSSRAERRSAGKAG